MIIGVILITFLCLNGVLAVSDVDMKVTGTIGDYASDVWLRTDSSAGDDDDFDAYDMPAPSSPDSYASFYSSITGATSVAVDSWSPATRTVDLYYDVPSGVSGNVVFDWDLITGTDYEATITITGNTALDMREASSDTYAASLGESIYITVAVSDYDAPIIPTPPGGEDEGGGGGGGAAGPPSTVRQPVINFIYNITADKLLFDTTLLITDEFKEITEGQNMRSTINLVPMGAEANLDVSLRYYVIDRKTGREAETGDAESGTAKITEEKTFDKTFYTAGLKPGIYSLWLELKYCTEWDAEESECKGLYLTADASSDFTVIPKFKEGEQGTPSVTFSKYKILMIILGAAVVVLIILIIMIVRLIRPKKRKK